MRLFLQFFTSVILISGIESFAFSQIQVPYSNNFDNLSDTSGWSHYAISGTDDWVMGVPNKPNLNNAYSSPNAWVNNLTGNASVNSNRVLETPSFDLSDQSKHYTLSFYQKRKYTSSPGYYIDYSLNSGLTWQLLYLPSAKSKNWQSNSGFTSQAYNTFTYSAYELWSLQGQNNVRFRFRLITNNSDAEGWLIDNFSIAEDYTNVFSQAGDTIRISTNCINIYPTTTLGLINQYQNYYNITTNCYISADTLLDTSDILVGTKTLSVYQTNTNWYATLSVTPGIIPGKYYLLYYHDALNIVEEMNEADNIGYDILFIDPVLPVPFTDDFENSAVPWTPVLHNSATMLVWQTGEGYLHHLEDAHSGENAWHTSKSTYFNFSSCGTNCNLQYVESPFINLASGNGNLVLNFWFKTDSEQAGRDLEYSDDCGLFWNNLTYLPHNKNDEWDFMNIHLNQISYSNNMKFRFKYYASYIPSEGMIFDDVYIGPPKPDLSIEGNHSNLFASAIQISDSLKYKLCNSGIGAALPSVTSFFWSTDTIFDSSDQYLGSKQETILPDTSMEWRYFAYSKPTSAAGIYYIFYVLDSLNNVEEMRETNNTGYFTISLDIPQTYPYFNDFETETDGWMHDATLGTDSWRWGVPAGNVLSNAFSGTKAWISNTSGIVPSMSRMHLYSPVVDLSSSTHPVIAFNMKLHCQGICHCVEAKANMSYSVDGGATWLVLDTANQSFNLWYYPLEYEDYDGNDYLYQFPGYTSLLFNPNERTFADFSIYNGRDIKRNTFYVLDMPFLAGRSNVRFRFNLGTLNNASLAIPYEGALIDNFQVTEANTDLMVDEVKPLMISSIANSIKLAINIKNRGNYYGFPSTANFYLSIDTLLDYTDSLIGQFEIPRIKPDQYYYLNTSCNAPSNLPVFKYLIYQLDAANVIGEPNELNNISYWPLALDSIKTYPYFMDFNDTVVQGWNAYVKLYNSNSIAGGFRFRNMVAPGEYLYQSDIQSGEMFTDRINEQSWLKPVWYLETPAFDFKQFDTLFMSFDLACTGRISSPQDGGNLEYSIDGGNTFSLLKEQYGQAYNWYSNYLPGFYNEMGWSGPPAGYGVCILDSTAFDLSFLKGEPHVVLRYKYYSNWAYWGGGTVQGMRIDNFRIQAFTVDYIANDSMVPINASLTQTSIILPYSITNIGQSLGRNTKTRFYWSADNVLDTNDQLVQVYSEPPVHAANTLSRTAAFNIPQLIQQGSYYVFYITDADSNLLELNEYNNIGSFKLNFPTQVNYLANIKGDTVYAKVFQPSFQVTYSIINNGNIDGLPSLTSFFWSTDSIMDPNDINVLDITEVPVLLSDTTISTVNIAYPDSLVLPLYFLFYNADHENVIPEISEMDNVGYFKVLTDYNSNIDENPMKDFRVFISMNDLYINPSGPTAGQYCWLQMINPIGQTIISSTIALKQGTNIFHLPDQLKPGMYMIRIGTNNFRFTKKFIKL